MIGDRLVTKQSGPEGKPCNTVYIVEKVKLKRELYISIMIDRENACPLIICSPKGGMGIEEVDPQFILQKRINPEWGLTEEEIKQITSFLGFIEQKDIKVMDQILKGIYRCFEEKNATLIEINPLGVTEAGEIKVCDAKIRIDDNATGLQKDLFDQEDLSQKDLLEIQANKFDLNYVKLKGEIGCLVNGAGLAMATMDLINFKGGKPANFLDIGGGSNVESVKEAIKIINSDEEVKAILVNIFGGIVWCDNVVNGIVQAVKEFGIKKPIVMRIKGNKVEEAKEIIKTSGLDLHWQDDVELAAEEAIRLAH